MSLLSIIFQVTLQVTVYLPTLFNMSGAQDIKPSYTPQEPPPTMGINSEGVINFTGEFGNQISGCAFGAACHAAGEFTDLPALPTDVNGYWTSYGIVTATSEIDYSVNGITTLTYRGTVAGEKYTGQVAFTDDRTMAEVVVTESGNITMIHKRYDETMQPHDSCTQTHRLWKTHAPFVIDSNIEHLGGESYAVHVSGTAGDGGRIIFHPCTDERLQEEWDNEIQIFGPRYQDAPVTVTNYTQGTIFIAAKWGITDSPNWLSFYANVGDLIKMDGKGCMIVPDYDHYYEPEMSYTELTPADCPAN